MASTYIALLRGVNVGAARRVPMAALRELLTGLGYADVKTLLNSGNAVFRAEGGTPASHASGIAAAIAEGLQLDVPVIVRSARQLAATVAANPLADDVPDPARLFVAFVQDRSALAGLESIRPLVVAPERFAVGADAAYLSCPEGILQSKAGEALLGKAGRAATSRNWATVLKLHAMTKL